MHDDIGKGRGSNTDRPTAIVTGGSSGIGLEITKAFLDAGYLVVVGARRDRGLTEKFGAQVIFESIDVSEEFGHLKLVDKAIGVSGRLDVYINNAGFSAWRTIDRIDKEFLDEIIATNLKGAFWGCKAAASTLKPGGSIINISSIAGKRGSANNAAYVATKFGMNGLTQSLAKELGPSGVRVNALCPVLIITNGLLEALHDPQAPTGGADPEEFIAKFARENAALRRLPEGSDVGSACVFLASNAARSITGQCINVDCGVLPQ